jgi:hypothetical protein
MARERRGEVVDLPVMRPDISVGLSEARLLHYLPGLAGVFLPSVRGRWRALRPSPDHLATQIEEMSYRATKESGTLKRT